VEYPVAGGLLVASWAVNGSIAETVDRISEAAHGRGLRCEVFSRADNQVVLELAEPGQKCFRRLRVRKSRSGLISTSKVGRRRRSTVTAILLAVTCVLWVGACLVAIELIINPVSSCNGYDSCMVKGWAEATPWLLAIAGILVALPLIWTWRPWRRRCLAALDSLIDEITAEAGADGIEQ